MKDVTGSSVTEEPNHLDLVTFGKHTGETYQEVYSQDRMYCQWVLMTVEAGESSAQILRLAQYVYQMDVQETYLADPQAFLMETEDDQ